MRDHGTNWKIALVLVGLAVIGRGLYEAGHYWGWW